MQHEIDVVLEARVEVRNFTQLLHFREMVVVNMRVHAEHALEYGGDRLSEIWRERDSKLLREDGLVV